MKENINIQAKTDDMPTRKRNRLEYFDYSEGGAFFITITCSDMSCMEFGDIITGENGFNVMNLSDSGMVVCGLIENIEHVYSNVEVHKYVVMPNHIHLLIIIDGMKKRTSLINVIGQLKSHITKRLGKSVLRKSFYDRVLRNNTEYLDTWKYIDENIAKWGNDEYYC